MKTSKILSIIHEQIVSRWAEFLLIALFFSVDVNLVKPIYIHVLEVSAQTATILSAGMAIAYAIIAKICAKCLAKNQVWPAMFGFGIFLTFMAVSYIGLEAASNIMDKDPLMQLLDNQPNKEVGSAEAKRHHIIIGMTIALFSLAVFVGYLSAHADKNIKGIKKILKLGAAFRTLRAKEHVLEGQCNRMESRQNAAAETIINKETESLQANIRYHKHTEKQILGMQSYQLKRLAIIYNQSVSMVEAVYDKKNFFEKLVLAWKKNFSGSSKNVAAVLFIVLLNVSMPSVFAQQINLGYQHDVSMSSSSSSDAEFNPKQAFVNVISLVDIKDPEIGLNLYSSIIGEPGIPKINLAVLPASTGRFPSPSIRRKNLSDFIRKGLTNFQALDQVCDDKNTEIFRSLVALVDQLEPGAAQTILIVESDFISSGKIIDFMKYKDRISDLDKDFDKIIAAFKKDSELPDLSGFEVVMRTTGTSELALWSARWWRRAFYHFGAKDVKMEAAF